MSGTPARTTLFATTLAGCLPLGACGASTPADDAASKAGATASEAAPSNAEQPSRGVAADCPPAEGAEKRTTSFAAPPAMCIDPKRDYTATVTTDVGPFTIDLLEDQAPKTVNNFVFLARHKFYDGIVFHRVIPGFMNQTGDPQGTGMGGPGYEFEDELPKKGAYEIGSVAMANAGPNTNGSQFFTVTGQSGVDLPPQYSLFGKVTDGMDVLKKIEADGTPSGEPTTQHRIESVTITEK